VNSVIKEVIKDKIISAEFKREFSKALSIFMFYVQSGQSKKKYGREDIIAFLQREGFGKIIDELQKKKITQTPSRKKVK
jgi:hypothetical protein